MATGGREDRPTLSVLWRIENFRLWERHQTVITGPCFSPRTLEQNVLVLELFSNRSESDEHLSLALNTFGDALDFLIDCEFSCIGSKGSPFVSETVRNNELSESENIKVGSFLSCEEVFDTKKSDFLPHDTLTVRCRIWKSEGKLSNDEFISLRSRFERQVDNSFQWSIPEFSSIELNQAVISSVMLEFCNWSSEFHLRFSLKGESLEEARTNLELSAVSIYDRLTVSLKVSVLDHKQKAVKYVEIEDEYFRENEIETMNLSEFLPGTELLMTKFNRLNNDVLTFFVEFSGKLICPIGYIEREYYGPLNLSKDLSKCTSAFLDASSQTAEQCLNTPDSSLQVGDSLAILGDEFLTLYRDQSMSDFELCSDDVSFSVHKVVLNARSPVFRAMFSSNMEESSSKSLIIPDLDAHTLDRLLTFLYGGTVESLEWGNALKLYYAADKYQVHSLKRECCSFFRSNISVRNVVDIVTLADRHQDLDLKSFVHGFILSHFDETVSAPEWTKFLESEAHLPGITMHQIYLEKLKTSKC